VQHPSKNVLGREGILAESILPPANQKRFWRDRVKRAVGFIDWLGLRIKDAVS
jgi:hypothetical protein